MSIINYLSVKKYTLSFKEMIKYDKIPNIKKSLKRLKELGFLPEVIYDIGAYEGEFTDLCLELWNNTFIFSFEALPKKAEKLRDKYKNKNVIVKEAIVGEDNQKNVGFFSDETASSVLRSAEVYSKKSLLSQEMISLNSFIIIDKNKSPNFLKIDTQGYEFPILLGCSEILENIEVILVETNFIEIYEKVHLANEVIAYLAKFNFVIFDICEIHRRPLDNALFQIDFLFIKKDSKWRENKKWNNPLI